MVFLKLTGPGESFWPNHCYCALDPEFFLPKTRSSAVYLSAMVIWSLEMGLLTERKPPTPLAPWWVGLVLGTPRAFSIPPAPHTSSMQQAVLPRCLLIPSECADVCEACWCHSDGRFKETICPAMGRIKGSFWGWLTHCGSLHPVLQAANSPCTFLC